ncbi:hypothetical protein DASB73_031660 [Starmerella bacillaris]|uniref:Uncharacterized protein n=1 Tax=Starmerella bacillaris TaxID=1247836 RepID=A0AAV5RL67_STABA|nr:hypothetical protein DASB73_031660 [Starmerella bacillaris]
MDESIKSETGIILSPQDSTDSKELNPPENSTRPNEPIQPIHQIQPLQSLQQNEPIQPNELKELKELKEPSPKKQKLSAVEINAEKLRKEAEKKAEKAQKEADRLLKMLKKEEEKRKKEEERQAEKKRKEEERLAEKKRKEEERLAEKKRKEEERLAEKKRKEEEKLAEKQRKEQEKLLKDAEKLKKEAENQSKINAFFKKTVPAKQKQDSNEQTAKSDYDTYFLPFSLHRGGEMFSLVNNCSVDNQDEYSMDAKAWLQLQTEKNRNSQGTSQEMSHETSQETFQETSQENSQSSNNTTTPNININSNNVKARLALAKDPTEVAEIISSLHIRRLQFSYVSQSYLQNPRLPINEEFRPPFVGYKPHLPFDTRKELALNPFIRIAKEVDPNINYEYDSEMEWVEEEGGEDLRFEDSEDEREEDNENDNDKENDEDNDFLSDDDKSENTGASKPKFTGPLTPVLVWGEGLEEFRTQIFVKEPVKLIAAAVAAAVDETSMEIANAKAKAKANAKDASDTAASKDNEVAEGPSFNEIMNAIAEKVGFENLKESLIKADGSQATKTLHVELMKQQLHGATEKEIKRVFDLCAVRVGKKKIEKKWVLNNEARGYFVL